MLLSAAELEKQDREQKKREQKLRIEMEKAAREVERKKAAQQSKNPAPAGKKDEMFCSPVACPFIDFVTRVYDIQVVRREVIDGYASVLITFKKKAGLKPKSVDEKFMQHLTLHAWITELDHEPMRLEVQLLDPVSSATECSGRFSPAGSGGVQERRKMSDEVWAPVRAEVSMAGRLLVVKRNQRQIAEFSDFKKYTVETRMNVVPPGQ